MNAPLSQLLRICRALPAVCLLLAAGTFSGQAQEKLPNPDTEVPKELFLPKELSDDVGEKKKLLDDLYKQLTAASGTEEAKLITSAIERLWLRSGSDTVDLLMNRTGKLIQDDKHDLALNLLDSIIELSPDYPEAWSRRAAVQFVRKQFGDSLKSLRQALALDPSHYKAIEGLGLVMRELGEKEAALKAFRRALKVNPHLEDAVEAEKELAREVEGQGI